MKTLCIIILFLALLWLPATAMAQELVACELNYTVQVGDWLSKLADKYYGDMFAYPAILAATNAQTDAMYATITAPDLIEPGWTLCIPSPADAAVLMASSAGAGAQTTPTGLSPEALANATYTSEFTQSGTATLVDGEYREPAAPGSATETVVVLTPYVAYGQLDGQDVAAVVLVTNPGGSGTFYDLHVMVSGDGGAVDVASTFLGDRVQINSLDIQDNQIVVDMVQAGPDDPMCCPSQQVIKTYALQGDQLMETSSQVVEGAATLEGSSWVLTTLNGDEPLPDTTITADFGVDGVLTGTDGCNRYNASYQTDGNNVTISLGVSTMMACAEPIMNQAQDYMVALESAATYQIQGDALDLRDASGNAVATFTAQPTGLAGTSWNVIAYNNGREGW